VTKYHAASAIPEELPIGTVLVIRKEKNAAGAWTDMSYRFVLPDGISRAKNRHFPPEYRERDFQLVPLPQKSDP
jgi:hypothetical protein